MKLDFTSKSCKGKFSMNFFVCCLMIECSKNGRENYPTETLEQRSKDAGIKIQPWISTNWPSNNWAPESI